MLAVGDSTKLEVFFSTRSYSGWVTKRPRVLTNEKSPDSIHYVTIRTYVTSNPDATYYPIHISPATVNISQLSDILVDEAHCRIINVSDQPVAISVIAVPQDYLEVTAPGSIPAGDSAQMIIKVLPEAIEQSFSKSVTIEAGTDSVRFTIPIRRFYLP